MMKINVSGSMKCKLIEIDVILGKMGKVAALRSINIMIRFIEGLEDSYLKNEVSRGFRRTS